MVDLPDDDEYVNEADDEIEDDEADDGRPFQAEDDFADDEPLPPIHYTPGQIARRVSNLLQSPRTKTRFLIGSLATIPSSPKRSTACHRK